MSVLSALTEALKGATVEVIDLTALGELSIRRASHVEPDDLGQWWADLAPVKGPLLGPFRRRSQALDAERLWLERHLAGMDASHTSSPAPVGVNFG